MLRLRKFNRLCSSTLSDPANRLLKRTDSEGSSSVAEKKSSAVPPISKQSPLSDFRRAIKQGKGRSSKRKENRRLSFLFAHRRAYGVSPRRAPRRSRRPQTANPPLRFSENLPARKGRTRLRSSYAPLTRCRKALPTLRAPAYKSKTEVSLGFLLYLRRREPFLRSVAWRTSA